MVSGALPLLLVLFFTGQRNAKLDARAILSGVLIGSTMILYSAAITETTVLRAVLLFYLTPAWSILIECVFLGRKFTRWNALAFALAATGILLIFRGQIALDHWNIGDVMAFASGITWAAGCSLVFTGPDIGARSLSLFGAAGAAIVGIALSLLTGTPTPTEVNISYSAVLSLGTGTLYIGPGLIATLWSARRLTPTTLSFLLTGEIITGIASSALFLSEPFGWPEITGSVIIVCAALVEVVSPKPQVSNI